MIEAGNPQHLGAQSDREGANFAIYSAGAEAVELCLFDADGEQRRFKLPGETDGVWHGYLPGCQQGQRYGYRVHGPWAPGSGLRFNPSKLLIDPYARQQEGSFRWSGALYDYDRTSASDALQPNLTDSAPFMRAIAPDTMLY